MLKFRREKRRLVQSAIVAADRAIIMPLVHQPALDAVGAKSVIAGTPDPPYLCQSVRLSLAVGKAGEEGAHCVAASEFVHAHGAHAVFGLGGCNKGRPLLQCSFSPKHVFHRFETVAGRAHANPQIRTGSH
jgi:hypothetical protein